MNGHLAKLTLEPGDILVVTSPDVIDEDGRQRLVACVNRHLPGHKVIIMDGGLTLGAVKPTKEQTPK